MCSRNGCKKLVEEIPETCPRNMFKSRVQETCARDYVQEACPRNMFKKRVQETRGRDLFKKIRFQETRPRNVIDVLLKKRLQ